ncbi:hypothetical protein TCE0_044r17035 [Talaromyces pinophilus]|uniref:Uncharacterized protein n=1 Tax=Talaromyces pinophilus TaxID=128442 RepID=A0A478ED32_TALPI|nr:hypothetical protein TCE0_044r17035 [Talaromyces pinophilus]
MNPTSRELTSAITDFYSLVIKLPYIDPTALIYPPSQGWPDINAEELRKRGRTEEVIAILRQLPYLRRPDSGKCRKGWMIGPDSHAIAYCDGEVSDEELDKIQPTPGHCIWLANAANTEDGAALLLDVENGTITEYSVRSNRNVCLDTDQYESLPLKDRWMAHSTLPAAGFFRTWTNKYKMLEWMPFLKEGENAEAVIWFISPVRNEDIFDDDYSEDSDESYEPSSEESDDDDYDNEDDPYEYDSEYDSEYESDDIDDIPPDDDTLETKVQELQIDEDDFTKVGNTRERLESEIRSGNSKLLATDRPALENTVNVRWISSF